jgi:hypothetical protein
MAARTRFWLRSRQRGSSSRRVVVDLQGERLLLRDDCAAKPPGLFRATDDAHPATGILSTNAARQPFAAWTMVFPAVLHAGPAIGGGVAQVFPGITVSRYGARNVRAALRDVRDVLWRDLGTTEPEGYRPDRLTVLFAGQSIRWRRRELQLPLPPRRPALGAYDGGAGFRIRPRQRPALGVLALAACSKRLGRETLIKRPTA